MLAAVMPAELIVTAEAAEDLADTRVWYDRRRRGLGEEFLQAANAAVQTVLLHPEMYQVVRRQSRRAPIRRFPYAIFYEYEADTVTVYAVLHASRGPVVLRQRLP